LAEIFGVKFLEIITIIKYRKPKKKKKEEKRYFYIKHTTSQKMCGFSRIYYLFGSTFH